MIYLKGLFVSTHSRPKAAGKFGIMCKPDVSFQHTAARRRLVEHLQEPADLSPFQHTAARRRLALINTSHLPLGRFNTQPPEGGWLVSNRMHEYLYLFQHTAARRRLAIWDNTLWCVIPVSTHSRPKAAGSEAESLGNDVLFQHTAARRRLGNGDLQQVEYLLFQHTAARRRLAV